MSRTATVKSNTLISDVALYSLITHPKTTYCETLRKCLQRYRHTLSEDAVGQERDKHLSLRKQDVSTQCPLQIETPKQNKVVQRPPKAVTTFDHPFIYIFKSFQKQSRFQAKQPVWTLAGEGLCFHYKNHAKFKHPPVSWSDLERTTF